MKRLIKKSAVKLTQEDVEFQFGSRDMIMKLVNPEKMAHSGKFKGEWYHLENETAIGYTGIELKEFGDKMDLFIRPTEIRPEYRGTGALQLLFGKLCEWALEPQLAVYGKDKLFVSSYFTNESFRGFVRSYVKDNYGVKMLEADKDIYEEYLKAGYYDDYNVDNYPPSSQMGDYKYRSDSNPFSSDEDFKDLNNALQEKGIVATKNVVTNYPINEYAEVLAGFVTLDGHQIYGMFEYNGDISFSYDVFYRNNHQDFKYDYNSKVVNLIGTNSESISLDEFKNKHKDDRSEMSVNVQNVFNGCSFQFSGENYTVEQFIEFLKQ